MHLTIQNLYKNFGAREVLRGLDLEASSGRAFALLGRNGAGKTTTIRLIMDVFKPDRGTLLLDGQPLADAAIRIGYLPEERGLYAREPILTQMSYLGELQGLSRRQSEEQSRRWLRRIGLEDYARMNLDTLSKGNQQKVQVAVSLLSDPDLIIFDEPFSGLDPVNAQLLKEIVLEQVAAGKMVFFSSHQMSYVESICDDMGLLYGGRIVASGPIQSIRRSFPRDRIAIRLRQGEHFLSAEENVTALKNLLLSSRLQEQIRGLDAEGEGAVLRLAEADAQKELFRELAASNYHIEALSILEPSLEEIFVHYTGESAETAAPAEILPEDAAL